MSCWSTGLVVQSKVHIVQFFPFDIVQGKLHN